MKKAKACPVCGWINGPGHAPWCTPTLRSLVRAAETWERAEDAYTKDALRSKAFMDADASLVRAVRRFRATKEKR